MLSGRVTSPAISLTRRSHKGETMRHRNPFANRQLQSTRQRRRAAEPSTRQAVRIIDALKATAAREIRRSLADRIDSPDVEVHGIEVSD